MTNKQFEQIESLSKKLWEDINNGHEYSMVTYTEFLGIVTEVWEKLQKEPVSEDLGEYINELSKQFPEVSFAKLSRIAVRVAKWQEEKDKLTWEDIEAIDDIFTDVFKDGFDVITNDYYQEVLKRFKEIKNDTTK